jgi:hypothetical protein
MLPHSRFMVFVCIQFSLSLYLILKRRSQNSEGIGKMLPPFKGEHFGLDNSTCTYHKSMIYLGIVDDIAHPLMIFLIALMLLDEQLVMNP